MTGADIDSNKTGRKLNYRRAARILLWIFGVPAVAFLVIYAKLLFGPMPVPFVRDRAMAGAIEALPENLTVVFGEASLAIEGGLAPVIVFTPVSIRDSDTGADIKMDKLEVGFSPVRALFGQPGISVTMVRPHFQVIQDLFGPRLAGLELVDDLSGDPATVWVMEGRSPLPSVRISAEGLAVNGPLPANAGASSFRSDNDWLIFNLLATEESLAAFEVQSREGRFSRLRVRDGVLDMHDSVYGLFRQFTDVELDIAPSRIRPRIRGTFAATLAGRRVEGTIVRSRNEAGNVEFESTATNLDFATLLPFIDDPDGLLAVRGAGDLAVKVEYSAEDGRLLNGVFDVDMSGAELRVDNDTFPIVTENVRIEWQPDQAQFRISDAGLQIGQSAAELSGVFVMGLDKSYGPTLSMSLDAKNVVLHPNDMDAPEVPFDDVSFTGWSAPLYGALGIDQLVAKKPGVLVRTKGRADMVRAGIGIDMELSGSGASADDLKRLWPYFLSGSARDWFVANVMSGAVENAAMRFNFPVGSMAIGDEDKPVPEGALSIDIIGNDVEFTPTDTMAAIRVDGETRLQVRDDMTTVGMDGATLATDAGPVKVSDAALIIDTKGVGSTVFELSGDVDGDIPSLLALTNEQSPGVLSSFDAPVAPETLSGMVKGSLVATIVMEADDTVRSVDYAVNAAVDDFASSVPIENVSIDDGDLTFSVTPAGYSINGTAKVSGIDAVLDISGQLDGEPNVLLSSELDVAQLAEMGFDASAYLNGKVRFVARPVADGSIQVAADLKDAALTVTDIGISKAAGVAGSLNAAITPDGDIYEVSDVSLTFADVDIKGGMIVDNSGLKSAEFSTFKLSPGDRASVNVTTTDTGIDLVLRGDQLDLKPMLKRFFALDQASTGGPQATQLDQAISLDVELKQAVGFYRTTAYNLDLELALKGEDIRNVSMQAQFAEGSAVSIATNPTQSGRTMSVAFNDLGTLLRFLNVYPRLLGGQGSLTLAQDTERKVDRGDLRLRDFALVDEEKVVEILGNHRDSRALVANENRLNFNDGEVQFIRRSDRIEVVDAVLDGNTTGGTMRGFVYTKTRQYDLTGTYIPLFALNNIFQKLPIVGQILGGRDGEGLVGVTFAVRGSLDDPQFLINPASILLPGAFRGLMEFRSREAPRETQ